MINRPLSSSPKWFWKEHETSWLITNTKQRRLASIPLSPEQQARMRSIWHYGSCAPTLGAFSQSQSLCSSASLGKDLKTAIYKNHFRHLWEDNNLPLTGMAINREPFNLHSQALKGQLVWQYSYTLNDGRRTAAIALLHHSGAVLTKQTFRIYLTEAQQHLYDWALNIFPIRFKNIQ